MHNLKVWQKLMVMGAIFLLPFGAVTYTMTSSIRALGVEFAQRELEGLDRYAPQLKLVRDLQQHRGLAAAGLAGDASFKDRLAKKGQEIDADVKTIDEISAGTGVLHGSERWASLSAACRSLVKDTPTLSPTDSLKRHTAVIASALGFINELGDTSNLTLDPDIDSKYLMQVLVFQGPELSELLGQARAIGSGMITAHRWNAAQIAELNRLASLVEFLQEKIDRSIAEALAKNDSLKKKLQGPVQANNAAVRDAVRRVRVLAEGQQIEMNADDYFAALTQSIDSIFDLSAKVSEGLTELLNRRVEKFEREIVVTLAWAALGLFVACLLGIIMIRDVTSTLSRVVHIADRIALGDLSVDASWRARRDEIGALYRAFEGMVAALKEKVDVAKQIAAGDLSVQVHLRSDRDALGQALANMVDQLSTLVGEVHRSGQQVNTSVHEIAATAKQQQATATEIAATTTEIGATSREIAATSRELVRTMSEVSAVAEESAGLASNGQVGLTRMEETMRHVMDAAVSINARLAVLNEKAGNINQVVTTITKVADQTNLLSLNAAIEAEKAGEYGRGFAVVATEIRRLADQTAVATHDIAQMVKEIQSAVSAGVMGMDKFSEEVKRGMLDVQQVSTQLSQVIQQVQALAPRFDAVNDGMQAQASGAEQITHALTQLGEAAQQTVDSLRQSGQTIDTLNQAATGMRGGVARFTLAA
jgi:methyl-accepting chemotaxis protein